MRIGLFGNVANSLLQMGRALRSNSDLDVHLFVRRNEERIRRPASDYPELKDGLPEWIHEGEFGLSVESVFAPWRSTTVAEMRKNDLLVTNGHGPMFAQFSERPWAFFATGGDLTTIPFPWRFRSQYRTARARCGMFGVAPWQRRAIRRATDIWVQKFPPNLRALDRLHVEKDRISPDYFPFPLDTELFSPLSPHRSETPQTELMATNGDFTIFHPSRLMMVDTRERRESGQWKGNDVLLRGFANFATSCSSCRPLLVLIDRTESPDNAVARRMIDELKIADRVLWLRPPRPDGFTRSELISVYGASDVVVDEFGIGWFGSVALEGLAMAKPVVSYVDEGIMSQMYPWHPFLSGRTAEDVAEILTRLASDASARQTTGTQGRAWMESFHSYAAVAPKYAAAITDLAGAGI